MCLGAQLLAVAAGGTVSYAGHMNAGWPELSVLPAAADEWFAELVHRYERDLFNYLRRYLGDADQADDAFQATFLQVHLKRDQFEACRTFRPWLYTLATHQAIDLQRRNRRHRMLSLRPANRRRW